MNRSLLAALLAAVMLTGCASTAPTTAPASEDRFLVDPRLGYDVPAPEVDRRFDAAWREFQDRDYAQARRRLSEIVASNPDYLPATLALAAIDIRQGNLSKARTDVDRVLQTNPQYTAARVYAAEIALAQRDNRRAYETYRDLSLLPDAPTVVRERLAQLERAVFEELYTAAQTASDDEAIRLLREALTINSGATDARIMLAKKLVAQKNYDEAQLLLEPLRNSPEADRDDVQEAVAEIEAGRGLYQEAIVRYERLSRRSPDPRFTRRLEDLKELWNAANMPPQFQMALESQALTRGDFAVLVFWKVNQVRFAQNLPTPPIAVDIADVPERDEIIRAIAVGLYDIDPITRRVWPQRELTAASLTRLAGRVLAIGGAPCARGVPAADALTACGIADATAGLAPEAPVSGQMAAALLNQVNGVLSR